MVLNLGSGAAPRGQTLHGPDHQRRLLRPQAASEAETEAEEDLQGHLQRGADAAPPRPQGPPRPRRPHGRGQGFKLTTSPTTTSTTINVEVVEQLLCLEDLVQVTF